MVKAPRILFVSQHSLLDSASGAALATRDLLELLAARGWRCGAVCGPTRDGRKTEPLVDDLARLGLPVESRNGTNGGYAFRVHHVRSRGVPMTLFDPDPTTPTPQVARTFAGLVGRIAERFEPEVILTYGGDPATRVAIEAVRKPGVKVVFNLRNFAYRSAEVFRTADAVIVPSAFARDHYRTSLGLECAVLPGPIAPDRVVCERIVPRYATFVNPLPQKGAVWIAGLIAALAARKSPVRWLIVEGRAGIERLGRCGIDLAGVNTVRRLRNTPDPRAFYSRSRVVVVPSLWEESFGRVAAEAVMNGIPVIASDRGALPEVLAAAGRILPIPARHTPTSRLAPTADELAPWVEAIERLWGDPLTHAAERARCLAAAAAWHPDVLMPHFEAFFRAVVAGNSPKLPP